MRKGEGKNDLFAAGPKAPALHNSGPIIIDTWHGFAVAIDIEIRVDGIAGIGAFGNAPFRPFPGPRK
jgi:hypothetical protein